MLKSMTGYGKETFVQDGVSYLLEIYSVNRKMLDISVFLPKELLSLEIDIRKWVGSFITRGQVTVKLAKAVASDCMDACVPEASVFKAYKKAWEKLAEELFIPREQISIAFLMEQFSGLPRVQKTEWVEFTKALHQAFNKAMQSLLQMKADEGFKLSSNILEYLANIKRDIEVIGAASKDLPQEYRKKLELKLQEFDFANLEVQERIARELVLYVDKSDITEEIDRLTAHLDQFAVKVQKEKETVGKALEFLLVEMQREVNTIASKSSKMEILNKALGMKGEIEKIREQVCNIE